MFAPWSLEPGFDAAEGILLTTNETVGVMTSHDTPMERLSGSVERVTFHSEESGFCVLRVKVKGRGN